MEGSQQSKNAALSTLLKFTILALVFILAFSSRLFAVIRFESIIHEFDPWFDNWLIMVLCAW